jgi:hypothetical protein
MKSDAVPLDTHQKALAINLDPTIFGSFAEIGAGQEVARWFLRVGAASGTVAKTVSAYSKPVSDSLYGTGSRYVSMQRLEAMIEREWNLLLEQLQPSIGSQTRLFSFADTVSARNFAGTNECHGWMGIRFQDRPEGTANDILLHLNLRDPSNLLQQEALGVVGVNLIYAVFHLFQSKESSLKALLDEVTSQRVEIDFIELRGPAFEGWDRHETLLTLVREGLAEAVAFSAGNSQAPPTEILRKRPIVLAPFGPRSIESTQREMLSAAMLQLKAESEIAASEPLSLFALTTSSPSIPYLLADSADLSHRVDALRANSSNALVFGYAELYRMTSFVNRYTQAPVRFAVEVSVLIHFLSQAHGALEGRLLEGLSRLFAQNVRVYAYPTAASAMQDLLASASAAGWQWEEKNGVITADALRPCAPLGHLYSYLIASGFIVPMQCIP